jgi:ATP-dependent DNA helicase Q1
MMMMMSQVVKSASFLSKLEKAHAAARLSRIAIDEAHCCSAWGHDFRPDYKQLALLKGRFPSVPIIALTATATSKCMEDVKTILRIERCQVFKSPCDRPNLHYEVCCLLVFFVFFCVRVWWPIVLDLRSHFFVSTQVRVKSDKTDEVFEEIVTDIRNYWENESGIVYCFSKKDCDTLADYLSQSGIPSASYHADLTSSQKDKVHTSWYRNKTLVIVATIAFGMGINKPEYENVVILFIS